MILILTRRRGRGIPRSGVIILGVMLAAARGGGGRREGGFRKGLQQ